MTLDRFRHLIAERRDRISSGQTWKLNQLATELGWSERQVVGLAQRMYGRVRRESLTRRQAAGLIEALKAVCVRAA